MASLCQLTPSIEETAAGFWPARSAPAAKNPAGVAITAWSRVLGSAGPGQTRCQPAASGGIDGPLDGVGDGGGVDGATEAEGTIDGAFVVAGEADGRLDGCGVGVDEVQAPSSTMARVDDRTVRRKG